MTKTNVMRLLEAAGIAYRTAEYEYDEANLSGLHAAEQVGMDAEQVFFKEPTIPPEVAEYEEPVDLAELVGDMNLAKLDQIFKSIMKKQVDKIDPVRSKFGKIEKEEVSLSDKMLYVEDFCKTHRNFMQLRQLQHCLTESASSGIFIHRGKLISITVFR